ncbi:MAG: PEP-CTERM sorting domain-containing protein, partial [Chthoniobacterales bacterium]
SVTLSVFDTYFGFGGGSWGLSYWFQISNALAPFVAITNVTYFTFTDPNYVGTFPLVFDTSYGADPGFMSTYEAFNWSCGGQPCTGDLGGTTEPFTLIPDGTYHVADITFAIAAGAPPGIYSLRTTTLPPRGSIQVTSDFNDAAFPQASFTIIRGIPEPSTLALLGSAAVGAGVVAYRRRKG